jgi:hypothetical protein
MKATLCVAALLSGWATAAVADPVSCNLSAYKALPGLSAANRDGGLSIVWDGDAAQSLRLTLEVTDGAPRIRTLGIRRGQQDWVMLARDLSPDLSVMTGLRRISSQQLEPLYGLGTKITQDDRPPMHPDNGAAAVRCASFRDTVCGQRQEMASLRSLGQRLRGCHSGAAAPLVQAPIRMNVGTALSKIELTDLRLLCRTRELVMLPFFGRLHFF